MSPLTSWGWLVVLCIGGALFMACATLTGCPSPALAEATYGGELQTCTQVSHTLAESIACENDVRARWGRPARDGGAE